MSLKDPIMQRLEDGKKQNTLLWLIDKTHTAFGKRLLREWLQRPLKDANAIEQRLDAVAELTTTPSFLEPFFAVGGGFTRGPYWMGLIATNVMQILRKLPDLEHRLERVKCLKSRPQEFVSIIRAVHSISEVLPAPQMVGTVLLALSAHCIFTDV